MIDLRILKRIFEDNHRGWYLASSPSNMSHELLISVCNSVTMTYQEAQNLELVYGKLEALFPRKKGPAATKTIRMHEPWFRSSRRRKKK